MSLVEHDLCSKAVSGTAGRCQAGRLQTGRKSGRQTGKGFAPSLIVECVSISGPRVGWCLVSSKAGINITLEKLGAHTEKAIVDLDMWRPCDELYLRKAYQNFRLAAAKHNIRPAPRDGLTDVCS